MDNMLARGSELVIGVASVKHWKCLVITETHKHSHCHKNPKVLFKSVTEQCCNVCHMQTI